MQTHDFNDGNGPVPAHQHVNGGGWVADTAHVSEFAYVELNAQVYGNARAFSDDRSLGMIIKYSDLIYKRDANDNR
jgi:hypothetical protein